MCPISDSRDEVEQVGVDRVLRQGLQGERRDELRPRGGEDRRRRSRPPSGARGRSRTPCTPRSPPSRRERSPCPTSVVMASASSPVKNGLPAHFLAHRRGRAVPRKEDRLRGQREDLLPHRRAAARRGSLPGRSVRPMDPAKIRSPTKARSPGRGTSRAPACAPACGARGTRAPRGGTMSPSRTSTSGGGGSGTRSPNIAPCRRRRRASGPRRPRGCGRSPRSAP